MNELALIEADALVSEVARYLAVVDAFRLMNCEPHWRPELVLESDRLTPPVGHLQPDRLRGPS